MRGIIAFLLGTAAATGFALAQDVPEQAPPPAPFAQVSSLVSLPDFIPGLGTLYVDPATLPAGPFLAYDHDGKLSATVYMPPFDELEKGTAYENLAVGSQTVTSVDILYNPGHPGIEKPHAHVILYHDDAARDRLAK